MDTVPAAMLSVWCMIFSFLFLLIKPPPKTVQCPFGFAVFKVILCNVKLVCPKRLVYVGLDV